MALAIMAVAIVLMLGGILLWDGADVKRQRREASENKDERPEGPRSR